MTNVLFKKSSHNAKSAWVLLFFSVYLLIGLSTFDDYGLSTDEPYSRKNGLVTLKYLSEKFAPNFAATDKELKKPIRSLADYKDKDYGIVFETPVVLIERLMRYNDPRDIYLLRHLLTFLVCFLGVIAVYKMAKYRFDDWRIGLLGSLILILSPRLFAESFYNDKDAVFMAFFAIAQASSIKFLLKPSIRNTLGVALATALAIDIRIMAVAIPVTTLIMLIARGLKGEIPWRAAFRHGTAYVFLTVGFVITFWPYLWSDPWSNFTAVIRNMAQFRWVSTVLFCGHTVWSTNLPWYYLPVWITISTPLFYLPLFGIGVIGTLKRLISNQWQIWCTDGEWQDLLYIVYFFGPILSIIILKSVVYDGWRHIYFVYPAFVLLTLRGLVNIWNQSFLKNLRYWRLGVAITCILCFTHIGFWMIKVHPFQNVFFNKLSGKNWKEHFEVDYWSLSARAALEYILEYEKQSPIVKVWSSGAKFVVKGAMLIQKKERRRIVKVDEEESAQYVITNYRWNPTDYASEKNYDLIKHIMVGNEIITSIYKKEAEQLSILEHPITDSQAKKIKLKILKTEINKDQGDALIQVQNGSNEFLNTISLGNDDVKLSWRLAKVTQSGEIEYLTSWDKRKDLVWSIEPNALKKINILFDHPNVPGDYILEVSMVQEGVHWLHDIGMNIAEHHFSIINNE